MKSCHIFYHTFQIFLQLLHAASFMKAVNSLDKSVFSFQFRSRFWSSDMAGDAGFFKISSASLPEWHAPKRLLSREKPAFKATSAKRQFMAERKHVRRNLQRPTNAKGLVLFTIALSFLLHKGEKWWEQEIWKEVIKKEYYDSRCWGKWGTLTPVKNPEGYKTHRGVSCR